MAWTDASPEEILGDINAMVSSVDPNMERAIPINQAAHDALARYSQPEWWAAQQAIEAGCAAWWRRYQATGA